MALAPSRPFRPSGDANAALKAAGHALSRAVAHWSCAPANEGDISVSGPWSAPPIRLSRPSRSRTAKAPHRRFRDDGRLSPAIRTSARFTKGRTALVGGPAIRNMATVGGNLFRAHPLWRFRGRLCWCSTRRSATDDGETAHRGFPGQGGTTAVPSSTSVRFALPKAENFRFPESIPGQAQGPSRC